MRAVLCAAVLAGLAVALPGRTQQEPARVPAIQEADKKPGYGTVEKIEEVRVRPERSAAAGGSSATGGTASANAEEERPAYRVTVRMADGSIQQRDLHKPEFKAGDDVLLTNAGDVVKD